MSRNSIPVDWCIKDANTKAFHDTWLVRSRTPLPDMSSQSFKDELGQLLTMVQNKGTDNAAFLDSGLLLRAFKFILLAGGYIEDYRNLEDDKYQPGYFRWDAARVAAVAGHSQPSVPYLEFARTMELTQAARDRVAECNGEEPVDVMQVIWQAGADLVIEYGRVLPERKRPGGRSQYDLLERWIEQNPSRMAKLLEWPSIVAESDVMDNWLRCGLFDETGWIRRKDALVYNLQWAAEYFGLVNDKSAVDRFGDDIWPIIGRPLVREAYYVRRESLIDRPAMVLPDLFAGRGVIWVGAGGVWLRRTGAGALRVLFGGADCQWNYVVAESASGEEMAFVHRSLQLQRTTRRSLGMALELHNGLSHLNPVIGASAGLPLPMSLMEVELQNFATPLQAVVDSVVEAVAARKAARGHVVTAATFGGCGIEFRIPQHILRRRSATGTTESVFNGDRMQSEWQDDDEEVWEEQVAADDANTTAADLDIPDEIADLPMGHAAAGVEGEGMSGGGPQETEDAGAPHGDAPAAADVPPEAPKATEVEEDGEEGEEGVGLAIAKDQVVSKTGRANAARAKEAFRLRDDVNVDDKTMSKKEREAHARAVRNAGIDIYADEDGEVEIGLGFGTARFSAYDVETLGLPDAPTKPQDADAVVARWTALCAEEGEAFEAAGEPVAPSVTGAAGLQGRPKSDYSQIARNVEAISEFLMGNAEDCPRGNPANARLTSFNRQMFYDNLCCIRLVMCRCPHMSLEMRQELADNIAAVFAFAFHSKKYFLWAAGIDIVCDTVCSKAKFSDHLSRSERQVLFGDVCSLREFGNGSLIAATIASRSWLSSKLSRRRTGVRWLANLVSPYRAFGYRDNDIDGSSKCTGCYGKRPRLLPAPGEENGRLFYDVAIKERLSVSVYAVRRGWDHSTKDLERDFHYICLVVLIWLEYHDGFIIIFLYFACLVHQQDRVHRWKMTAILTPQGLYLPAYGIAYADI